VREKETNQTIPWKIRAQRCALIVIDMQNDFIKPGGALYSKETPMEIVPNIKTIIDLCHEKGIPVIYTQTMLKDEFNISPLEVSYQPILIERGMREGTWGYEIIDELTPQPEDHIVIKHRYDAFYNTNLRLTLNNIRGLGVVDTVIIVGTLTNVCCETTARSAFMNDYKVVFVSDANGTFDEKAHQATLFNISHFFGRVLSTQELIKVLNEGEENRASIMD
jgi:nicotinamidase-related amidase